MHYLYLLLALCGLVLTIGLVIELVSLRQAIAALAGGKYTPIPWRIWLPYAVLVLAALALIYEVRGVLAPFVVGLVIAYLFNPVLEFLERHGWRRVWAMGVVGAVLIALFVVVAWKLVPLLVNQFTSLSTKAPPSLDKASEWLQGRLEHSPGYIRDWVQKDLPNQLKQKGSLIAGAFVNWSLSAFSTVMMLVLGLIVAIWLLADYGGTRQRLLAFIPERQRATILEVGKGVSDVLGAYLRGMALMCGLVGMCALILLWSFGVPYFLLLAMLVGFGYAIPYFGVPISVGVVAAFAVSTGHHWQSILALVLCLLLVNFTTDYVLTPRIVGKQVGLHGLVVMFSLLAGASLFGLLGMVIAVPVAASIKVILTHIFPRLFDETPS